MFQWLWRKICRLWRRESAIYLGGAFTEVPKGTKIAMWSGAEWIQTKCIPGGAYRIVVDDDDYTRVPIDFAG